MTVCTPSADDVVGPIYYPDYPAPGYGGRFVNDAYYPVDPLMQRLFRHMHRQTRGRNLFLMSDGTVVDSQVGGTPPNMILPRTDPYVTVFDATSGSLQITQTFQTPYVTAVMYGGSANPVTAAQAAQLTAAGFGSTLT